MTAQVQILAEKLIQKREVELQKRKLEITTKYPQADADSLRFDETANKYAVTINCVKCGDARDPVFTSDLFQVTTCIPCALKLKAERKLQKKAIFAEALELVKSKK